MAEPATFLGIYTSIRICKFWGNLHSSGTIPGFMGEGGEAAIRYALETASRLGFRTIRIKQGDVRFRAELGAPTHFQAMPISEGNPELEIIEPQSESVEFIEAPMVGFFRFSRGTPQPGDEIQISDVIGSITALGIVSEVVSSVSGEIAEVLVAEGDPVEYGQPLLRIEVGI